MVRKRRMERKEQKIDAVKWIYHEKFGFFLIPKTTPIEFCSYSSGKIHLTRDMFLVVFYPSLKIDFIISIIFIHYYQIEISFSFKCQKPINHLQSHNLGSGNPKIRSEIWRTKHFQFLGTNEQYCYEQWNRIFICELYLFVLCIEFELACKRMCYHVYGQSVGIYLVCTNKWLRT